MRISILTLGSRGDVVPYVALGVGLRSAGHEVTLATHDEFAGQIQAVGLAFRPMVGSPTEIIRSVDGARWQGSGRNPISTINRLRRLAAPLMDSYLNDVWAATADVDAVLFSPLGNAAYHAAQARQIPAIGAWLAPMTPTTTFPSILTPVRSLGPFNRWSHTVVERAGWLALFRKVDVWRKEIGLVPLGFRGPFTEMRREAAPVLYGYSAAVASRPADWPASHRITGYWFDKPLPGWQPPAALVDFLGAGEPPVYIGFGSRIGDDPERLTAELISALKQSRRRAVLATGWGGVDPTVGSDEVFVVDEVRHDWLFPQMAAVVHHGGAGTSGAGFRSGVPSVVAPTFADQFFWAERSRALGVGPRPLRPVTASLLVAALDQTDAPVMRKRAAQLGSAIRGEDGVGSAIDQIDEIVSRWSGRPT